MNPARKKDLANHEHLSPDLLAFKRRMEAAGVEVQIPQPGAKWIEREPIDFGDSVGDMVIRLRGKEP